MRNLYILFITVLFSYSAQAQLGTDVFSVGNDNSNNYAGTWGTVNLGNGFSDWVFDTAIPSGGFAGRFISSFSGALDVSGNSFGMFANSVNDASSGAATTFPKSLEEGDSFTVSVGVNFRDGNKGFDLRDSSNTAIINFNVASDEYNITGTSGLYSNTYDANTVITFTFTQNANNVTWIADRSGGLTASQNGTIASINPGTIENIRFYNTSAGTNNDGGAGQRNLYVNSLEFNSLFTITGSSTVASSGDSTVPYLDIQNGSILNIPANSSVTVSGNLTNSGTLNLNSTSIRYSSLIVDNVTNTGTINYNRHINNAAVGGTSTTANDLISAPLSGMSFGDLRLANSNILSGQIGGTGPTLYLFGPFDNSSVSNYLLYEETVDDGIILDTGVGYRTGSNPVGAYLFTGDIETGNIPQLITTPTGGSIWNLVGNPYPSYIRLDEFLSINNTQFDGSSTGIYGYDGAAADGWNVWNSLYSVLNPDAVIAPGQGFFVASKDSGGTINFNPNMRSSGASDDFIPLRSSAVITNVQLDMTNGTNNFSTEVYFTEFSSLGLDPGFDSSLFGSTAPAFSIYSNLVEEDNGIPFGIQALGEFDYANTTVPLGVNANQGEQLTFSLSINTLPATVSVFLDDTVASASTLLNSGDYVFTPAANLSGTGRFFLRFADSALSTIENSIDALSIFTNPSAKTITITGQLLDPTQANVYDLQGRLVAATQLETAKTSQSIDVSNLSTGVYVIQLTGASKSRSQKLIIR
jgi:hypothetical protein